MLENDLLDDMNTLEKIHLVAKREFLAKGFKSASLRNIVREVGLTTGAFYGYYASKEELFDTLVRAEYEYVLHSYKVMHDSVFGADNGDDVAREYLSEMLHYTYEHLDEFRLLLCSSEGTHYEDFIDQIVDTEDDASGSNSSVRSVDDRLRHMLITGVLHTFFEVVMHDVDYLDAEQYVAKMYTFYKAGFGALAHN